jgi:hypothetical protein
VRECVYVLLTSVNVVLHRLVCCRLTICKTTINIFNSIYHLSPDWMSLPADPKWPSQNTYFHLHFVGARVLMLTVPTIAFLLLTVMSLPPFLLWLCQLDIVNTGARIVRLVVIKWYVCVCVCMCGVLCVCVCAWTQLSIYGKVKCYKFLGTKERRWSITSSISSEFCISAVNAQKSFRSANNTKHLYHVLVPE